MTPEERFTKIEEKHQALAQTVEILASLQVETERKLQAFIANVNEFSQRVDRGMFQVARILDSHDARLDSLEGNTR